MRQRLVRETERNVTATIKTMLRPDSLARLVASLRACYPRMPIVIADDGGGRRPVLPGDVRYLEMPFDAGSGAGRNLLLEQVETPYFLYLDDDYVFDERTRIHELYRILQTTDIDLVGGGVDGREDCGYLMKVYGRSMVRIRGSYGEQAGCRLCDWLLNFWLAKPDAVRAAGGWDERLKTLEHSDFFWRVKDRLKIAYCPAVRIGHEPSRTTAYAPFRDGAERLQRLRQVIYEKHGVAELCWADSLAEAEAGVWRPNDPPPAAPDHAAPTAQLLKSFTSQRPAPARTAAADPSRRLHPPLPPPPATLSAPRRRGPARGGS